MSKKCPLKQSVARSAPRGKSPAKSQKEYSIFVYNRDTALILDKDDFTEYEDSDQFLEDMQKDMKKS